MGNTQYIAVIISEATGSDLFEIKTVHTYPGSHKALIDAAKVEIDNNARPKLATHIKNLKDYDVVFVGFPNWWYDMPMPLYSFFDEYDFGGKTVIPFCTHGGGGEQNCFKDFVKNTSKATNKKGFITSGGSASSARPQVEKWLKEIDVIK